MQTTTRRELSRPLAGVIAAVLAIVAFGAVMLAVDGNDSVPNRGRTVDPAVTQLDSVDVIVDGATPDAVASVLGDPVDVDRTAADPGSEVNGRPFIDPTGALLDTYYEDGSWVQFEDGTGPDGGYGAVGWQLTDPSLAGDS